MIRHLAKLLDAIWYLSMGLFLGLTGGLVLSVIVTFRGARKIDATPRVEPYSDPMFAQYHNDAVAGYIGQDLFMVGGTIAIYLLVAAAVSRLIPFFLRQETSRVGSKACKWVQGLALVACLVLITSAAANVVYMNKYWPTLYDPEKTSEALSEHREVFENLHAGSERLTSSAWLCGFIALAISPWCRRIADSPLQSGDGKE